MTAPIDQTSAAQPSWTQAHLVAVQAAEWMDAEGLIKRARDRGKIIAFIERAVSAPINEAIAEIAALSAERDRLAFALGDAARELPQVAGTVAHRIQVYREAYSEQVAAAESALQEVRRKTLEECIEAIDATRSGGDVTWSFRRKAIAAIRALAGDTPDKRTPLKE